MLDICNAVFNISFHTCPASVSRPTISLTPSLTWLSVASRGYIRWNFIRHDVLLGRGFCSGTFWCLQCAGVSSQCGWVQSVGRGSPSELDSAGFCWALWVFSVCLYMQRINPNETLRDCVCVCVSTFSLWDASNTQRWRLLYFGWLNPHTHPQQPLCVLAWDAFWSPHCHLFCFNTRPVTKHPSHTHTHT